MSRWSEYLNLEESSPSAVNWKSVGPEAPPTSGNVQKALHMEWVLQLSKVAEGLLTKMYRLNNILDHPDLVSHIFSDSFWKAGIIPNFPKICILVSKKFPEHPSKLQLERVDKSALDALNENAEVYFQSLEPWVMLLLDLMAFREQALRLILDLSSTVITLLPHQNSLILHAFMDLFCSFVRVNLFSDKREQITVEQGDNFIEDYYHSQPSQKWKLAFSQPCSNDLAERKATIYLRDSCWITI
ncbi:putative protein NAP1 [Cocos nucifera]|uniref:Uncharacterized protein n=1 Tax=Cocos nucifera TaxID=13894 RepID=A0A8K0ID22_COCNU|nr:putative protein NAP1 [Cocos nucifera]